MLRNFRLHEQMLCEKIQKFKHMKGLRTIRLDRSYTPDAIIIDWDKREVIALEVETRRSFYNYSTTHPTKERSRKTDRKQFDRVICVMKRHPQSGQNTGTIYSVDDYDRVMSLSKTGIDCRTISKLTSVPIHTVRNWVKYGLKPRYWKRETLFRQEHLEIEDYITQSLGSVS